MNECQRETNLNMHGVRIVNSSCSDPTCQQNPSRPPDAVTPPDSPIPRGPDQTKPLRRRPAMDPPPGPNGSDELVEELLLRVPPDRQDPRAPSTPRPRCTCFGPAAHPAPSALARGGGLRPPRLPPGPPTCSSEQGAWSEPITIYASPQ